MTRRDPAALWFGSDFYEDEQVLQMDYEQQGVYHRLLWISWRNGGIPSDPSTLAKMLAVPIRRFLRRIWPAIATCWSADGDRLIPRRRLLESPEPAAARPLCANTIRHRRMMVARRIGRHSTQQWKQLVSSVGGVCVRCGSDGPLEKDHIVPVSRGGSDGIDNLQPLCIRCNRVKGATVFAVEAGV